MLCFLYLLITSFLPSFTSCASLPNSYFTRSYLDTSTPKLSLADSAEWTEYHVREPEGPGTYSFGYDVEDSQTGNVQFRTEERRPNGTVTGSYGYVTPEGNVHVVHYVADHLGYRTKIEDAGRIRMPNGNYKSMESSEHNMSPQMIAALQSLGNYNRFQKEDQHVRPVDRVSSNSQNIVNNLALSEKEDYQENKNNVYKVYFVPPNYNKNN